MTNAATINAKDMDNKHFQPDQQINDYLQSLSATQLRELASYARKMAAGKENPARKPGTESGRWLEAQYVRTSGPYFYLRSYNTGDLTYTDDSGNLRSGNIKVKYVGRRLPAELAREFGYPEGATPEEAGIHITGTRKPRKDEK